MLTDKEALKTAKEELRRAIYLSECSRSAGIRAINEDKAEWLSVLICNAEQNMEGKMKTYKQLYDENGKYRLDESYTEILKLDKMLTDANIPHTLDRFLDGWQICYPNNDGRVADAIQHFGSYGNAENLLEIMGLVKPEETSDSVLGHLTAEDVFNRISEHYKDHPTEKGGGEE